MNHNELLLLLAENPKAFASLLVLLFLTSGCTPGALPAPVEEFGQGAADTVNTIKTELCDGDGNGDWGSAQQNDNPIDDLADQAGKSCAPTPVPEVERKLADSAALLNTAVLEKSAFIDMHKAPNANMTTESALMFGITVDKYTETPSTVVLPLEVVAGVDCVPPNAVDGAPEKCSQQRITLVGGANGATYDVKVPGDAGIPAQIVVQGGTVEAFGLCTAVTQYSTDIDGNIIGTAAVDASGTVPWHNSVIASGTYFLGVSPKNCDPNPEDDVPGLTPSLTLHVPAGAIVEISVREPIITQSMLNLLLVGVIMGLPGLKLVTNGLGDPILNEHVQARSREALNQFKQLKSKRSPNFRKLARNILS